MTKSSALYMARATNTNPLMNKSLKPIFYISFSIFLASCSGPNLRDGATHFHTRITDSGLKHFQLSIIMPPEERTMRRDPYDTANSRFSPEEKSARKAEKYLKEITALKIQETQYCREGYWFLGNNFYGRKVYIRGECNDTATDQDREKFPDTLIYW